MIIHNLGAVLLWLKLTKGWEFMNEKTIYHFVENEMFYGTLIIKLKEFQCVKKYPFWWKWLRCEYLSLMKWNVSIRWSFTMSIKLMKIDKAYDSMKLHQWNMKYNNMTNTNMIFIIFMMNDENG